MYEGDMQSVLRCGQCNKPFDKQSTLKRHGYYCRSRRAGNTTRSRSCISCARGKARCDNKQPTCLRCITKATECHYPTTTPKSTTPRTRRLDEPLLVENSLSINNRQEPSSDGVLNLESSLATSDPEFATIGEECLHWEELDVSFAEFLNDETVYHSPGSSSVAHHTSPSTDTPIQVHGYQAIPSSDESIPTQPTSNIRMLNMRPKSKTGPQRITNLILHTLKSYPLMMLRHNTLPPFIHQHLISSEAENNDMEPLTNCISLVHMISGMVPGSRKLFWKNVRLECERFIAEHLGLNKWELLAAMQALAIYILKRLNEGETDHNNIDFLLITAVTVIAKQLGRTDITCNTQSAFGDYSLKTSWKEWLYEESRRRLAVVYRVINMVVYFYPAAMCHLQTDLVLAPLPAKKHLWEAGDEFAWKTESDRQPGEQNDFALAANSDLVNLDGGQIYGSDLVLLYKNVDAGTSPGTTDHWEEWCSGMDGFGGLVILAASLIV